LFVDRQDTTYHGDTKRHEPLLAISKEKTMDSPSVSERRTVSVECAAREIGIGRATAYAAARRGELPGVIRIGRRVLISRAALDRYLNERDATCMMRNETADVA
jgi:excisionase family DNA binding protein